MKIKLALKILAKPDDETVVKMWKSIFSQLAKKQLDSVCLLAGEHGFYVLFGSALEFATDYGSCISVIFKNDFDSWMDQTLEEYSDDERAFHKNLDRLYKETQDWFFGWVTKGLKNKLVRKIQHELLDNVSFGLYLCDSESHLEDGKLKQVLKAKRDSKNRRSETKAKIPKTK